MIYGFDITDRNAREHGAEKVPEGMEIGKLIDRLAPGDIILMPTHISLGRDYPTILGNWEKIRAKGAKVRFLELKIDDTTPENEVVFRILRFIGECEHARFKQRQAAGIAKLKEKGGHYGPKPMEIKPGFDECLDLWRAGKLSSREAGKRLGVSHTTFIKWAKRVDKSDTPSEGMEED